MSKIYFLSIQGGYSNLDISLFQNSIYLQNIKKENINSKNSSSSILIPLIKKILEKNLLKIDQLKFICTDQGPGAFTSLRVIISTLNGLSYANKIPLIGIDGLDALALEVFNKPIINSFNPAFIIPLLNAYNKEVYYSINKIHHNKIQLATNNEKGYKKIEELINDLKNKYEFKKIIFIGNAIQLYKEILITNFKNNLKFDNQLVCSSKHIAIMALEKWGKKEKLIYKLSPLYLKSQTFTSKK